ncbi:MAG: hypothetical protein JSV87_04910 [Candidatus Bathyarchaeota archaeon]|nr:MAG: hypothetical protein JSV87_04910 [Candidatus Bathyarchaeota archaeon]
MLIKIYNFRNNFQVNLKATPFLHPSTVLFIGSVLHLALLPSGDTYTMDNVDATDAAIATYPRIAIPPCTVGAPNLKTSKREKKLNQPR